MILIKQNQVKFYLICNILDFKIKLKNRKLFKIKNKEIFIVLINLMRILKFFKMK